MGSNFDAIKARVEREFMQHPIVTNNNYCEWFAKGGLSLEDVRHFAVQFSVFSNMFLLAALNRVINADTVEAARESKEILMNELGVIYNNKKGATSAGDPNLSEEQKDRDGDPSLVGVEGTVDGGMFRFQAAHFEWLLRFGKPLGLTWDDMGKRKHGTKSTLFFCDELFRLYGAEDYNAAMGAAFAVENWAAAGFWQQLISGLEDFKNSQCPDLPLAFFTWHDKLEGTHKEHVWEELEEVYEDPKFNEDSFFRAGIEMLDGVKAFWDGLDADRKKSPQSVAAG